MFAEARRQARKNFLHIATENDYHLYRQMPKHPFMKIFSAFFKAPLTVKIEIESQFLATLMKNGQIHATDFRCLDLGSKQTVWQILLSLAKSRVNDEGKLQETQ